MSKSKKLQRQHEKAICDRFVELYNSSFKFIRFGNDKNEPDCFYEDRNEVIGIELSTAWYRNMDAKQEWTVGRGEREYEKPFEESWGDVLENPDDLMCYQVQKIVNNKCNKRYKGAQTILLCIEVRASLSDECTLRGCLSRLQLPAQNLFTKIYLLHLAPLHEGGNYKFFRVYPR